MPNWESDATLEERVIPTPLRAAGLSQCFAYHGHSMAPTFHSGHLLYVRPTARDIAPGDVIVFASPSGDACTVHRVVAVSAAGVLTRGDNNARQDGQPIPFARVVGRVEAVQQQGRLKPVRGGKPALWWARMGWVTRRARAWLRARLGAPYRALRASPRLRRVLARCFSRQIEVVRLETPHGPLVKYICRGRTVARWWPRLQRFECLKPYDLFIPRPEDAQ